MQVIMAGRPVAGYFVLKNNSDTQLSLTGASAPDCSSLMLHKSSNQNGTERMEMVSSVRIPMNGTVRFAPGGYHLMCMDPKGALLSGKGTETVTLQFADGGTLQAPFAIAELHR
jgi:copper(I)-binding protein